MLAISTATSHPTIETNDHDFGRRGGTVIPHSLYVGQGFVHLNTSHDTSDCLSSRGVGRRPAYYPKPNYAVSDARTSATMYLFKETFRSWRPAASRFAWPTTRLTARVDPIEHRLFPHYRRVASISRTVLYTPHSI